MNAMQRGNRDCDWFEHPLFKAAALGDVEGIKRCCHQEGAGVGRKDQVTFVHRSVHMLMVTITIYLLLV
jgi:hypothetical protein